ncbi:hypothetical protein E2320_018828 [Naja naja]|nr:hypothetical protein E2320_018828 [Naja naja]
MHRAATEDTSGTFLERDINLNLSLGHEMVLGSGHLFGIVRTFINPLLETDCIAESANVEHCFVYLESYVSLPSLDWCVCLLLSLVGGVFFFFGTMLGPCQNPAKCLSVYRKARKTGLKSAFDECVLTTIKSPSS